MRRNHYVEAMKETTNWTWLGSTFALSAITLNPAFFLAGVVGSAAWTLMVPDMPWFKRKMSSLESSDRERDAEAHRDALKSEVYPRLEPELQARYMRLERTRYSINDDTSLDDPWFGDIKKQLDVLLDRFLVFASKDCQFRGHLESLLAEARANKRSGKWAYDAEGASKRKGDAQTAPLDKVSEWVDAVVKEIASAYMKDVEYNEALIAQKQQDSSTAMDTLSAGLIDPDVMVLQKNVDVIRRRADYVGRMGKILVNLNYQMHLLENTFGLISDEIRAKPPKEVLTEVEAVVNGTQMLTDMIVELEHVSA